MKAGVHMTKAKALGTAARTPGLSPITEMVRALPGDYYILREVADVLGVTARLLRRLRVSHPELGPAASMMKGSIRVYLYTPDDVTRLLEHVTAHPPQQASRLWTAAEYLERQRGHTAVRYWRRRATALALRGDSDGAQAASERADQTRRRLVTQYDARRAEKPGRRFQDRNAPL